MTDMWEERVAGAEFDAGRRDRLSGGQPPAIAHPSYLDGWDSVTPEEQLLWDVFAEPTRRNVGPEEHS